MWQKPALEAAADQLDVLGHDTDAATVRYAVSTIDFQACSGMRVTEGDALTVDVFNASTDAEICACLRRLKTIFPIDHASIHMVNDQHSILAEVKVITTFDQSWIDHYVANGFTTIDPIMAASASRASPFFWSEIDVDAPYVRQFMEEAAEAGVGPSGYTIPVTLSGGDRYALSVSSKLPPKEFEAAIKPYIHDLKDFAGYFVSAFRLRLNFADLSAISPTEVELRLLKSVAIGKTDTAIEAEGFLDEPIEVVKKRTMTTFGAKSLEHALTLAIAFGKIVVAPLAPGEVIRAGDVKVNVEEKRNLEFAD